MTPYKFTILRRTMVHDRTISKSQLAREALCEFHSHEFQTGVGAGCGRPAAAYFIHRFQIISFTQILCWLFLSLSAVAATNSGSDAIPALRPPKGEIPPGYWDEHKVGVLFSGAAILIVICLAVWFLLRPREQTPIAPEALARKDLDTLLGQPENGRVLSSVSQILRRYVTSAFGLPAVELTTTEFCQTIAANASLGPELAGEITEFLRSCDRRKFAPISEAPPINAVPCALKFVEKCEARCEELRKAKDEARRIEA